MIYRVLADIVVVFHLAFILFVFLGGLLVLKWTKVAWCHVPMVIWGAVVEFGNLICPLTHLEFYLRTLGGERGYAIDFVEQYIVPIVYPAALTIQLQIVLGTLVLLINGLIYLWIGYRIRRRK
ncbi:MAG: DUF2784 domain-containing protein [Marinifilaceae bacterium]